MTSSFEYLWTIAQSCSLCCALNATADGRLDVEPLMTHTFPSSEFPAAYANATNYEDDVIKTLVVCECYRAAVLICLLVGNRESCRSRLDFGLP